MVAAAKQRKRGGCRICWPGKCNNIYPAGKACTPFNVSNVTKILMLLLNNVSNIIQHIYGFYGKRSNVTNNIKVHHYFNVTTICSAAGLSCPKESNILTFAVSAGIRHLLQLHIHRHPHLI